MYIAILGSMAFTDAMIELQKKLHAQGHRAITSNFAQEYAGKELAEIARLTIRDKNERNGLLELCEQIKEVDAVLVLNLDKRGIKNYIGGNTLIEMGYAFILRKKIYLWNPVPEIDYYKSEIEAMKPIIINQRVEQIV